MCSHKTLASPIAALGVFLCFAGSLSGEEGGSGDYAPGTYASLLNITPNVPGLAIGSSFIYYSGSFSGGKALPFGGLLAANINANVFLTDISLAYTFRPTILGAHYTC